MHCVYQAYVDYLRFLGLVPGCADWVIYHAIKAVAQGPKPQPTWGGLVPFLFARWGKLHDLRPVVQCRIVTKEHYLADAGENLVKRGLVQLGDFGEQVDRLTLWPAVYLCLPRQHAMFSCLMPSLKVVMALQLQERGK